MKKLIILFVCITPFLTVNAQSLSKQLWERVNLCYSNFEDMDEDGEIDFDELIDDSKNGYLKISGSWPTCGCGCSSTVGAFKGSDGKFTFLQKDSYSCSWIFKISSNRSLKEVFPENFDIQTFIPSGKINTENNKAYFYIEIDIPRYGTDTKVSIKPIPFGMNIKSKSILSFEYTEGDIVSNDPLWRINQLIREIQNEKTLDLLVSENFSQIEPLDFELINRTIGNDASKFRSKEELSKQMQELNEIYKMYSLILHEYVTMGWDREKARFYIKNKGEKIKKISFKEFLLKIPYWSPMC